MKLVLLVVDLHNICTMMNILQHYTHAQITLIIITLVDGLQNLFGTNGIS